MAEPLPDSTSLDPAEPSHVAFVQELFDRMPVGKMPDEAFVVRVAAVSPVATLRGEARLIMALRAQARGETEIAEQFYVQGLRLVWGGRSRYERSGLINFALMCLDQQRPLEAMLLSRRARDLTSPDRPFARALSELHLAGALIELGDFERASAGLARMDEIRMELAGRRRDYIELAGSSFRVTAAFHRDDAASAGEARAAMRRIDDSDFAGLDPRGVESLRGQAAFANHEPGEAVMAVQRRRGMDTTWDNVAADGDLLEVRSLLCLEQREIAVAAAECLVERLESDEGVALPPGSRLEIARRLGAALSSRDELAELATRALAVAGSAALERIWEADRFRRELPEFGWLVGDDRSVIDAYHERFVRDYDGVLDQVTRLLTSREMLEKMRSVHMTRRLVCVCAWCHRLRGPDGLWLDIGRFDPPGETVHLSHGACETCCERVLATVGLGIDGEPLPERTSGSVSSS